MHLYQDFERFMKRSANIALKVYFNKLFIIGKNKNRLVIYCKISESNSDTDNNIENTNKASTSLDSIMSVIDDLDESDNGYTGVIFAPIVL